MTPARPSRVLIYAHHAPPHPSACATRVSSLARHLRARGVEVSFLTSKPGPDRHEGFMIKRCTGRFGLFKALLAHKRCPIFVTSPPATPTAEVAWIARILGYHVVADIRDPFVSEALGNGDIAPGIKTRIKLWLERSLFSAAHQVAYVSDALRAQMDDSFGTPGIPQIIAPNGIDRDVFSLAENTRDATRKELGLGSGAVFVYAGILGGKSLELALPALAPALRKGAQLLMIAVEDDFSRPIMIDLKAQAKDLGVNDQILWRNNLSPTEVARHLNACDIGLNPLPFHRNYCLPVKTFEYLACGVHPMNIVGENSAVLALFEGDELASSCLSWAACSSQALTLADDVRTLRQSAEKRAVFAKRFDRNLANEALSEALLQ
ncbi:glycosyltransferase [Aliiroseovarius lamellibrachiae]|uniref:glycosyltransferase n=1 Tax=Aliiroseovarius lamellibrachiae TaxID=1924933 RepID=UPI001BE09401|nr:glycosyltransferase [Aliiroseovarius lamellibrachiae]MBT2131722.1 glycosyltransferase [Aliiroseovarius lamellibrachiae]